MLMVSLEDPCPVNDSDTQLELKELSQTKAGQGRKGEQVFLYLTLSS